MNETIEKTIDRLRTGLPSLLGDQPVILAYLYGSRVKGLDREDSDTDIALVIEEEIELCVHLKLILSLTVDLAEQCGVINPDVRILNEAPLVVKGRVVTEGVNVYARSERDRVEFETMTRARFFDYLPVHRKLREASLKRIKERGLYD